MLLAANYLMRCGSYNYTAADSFSSNQKLVPAPPTLNKPQPPGGNSPNLWFKFIKKNKKSEGLLFAGGSGGVSLEV